MRGSRSKVRQYEGERTFLYKEESIPNSLNNFTVRLNPVSYTHLTLPTIYSV